MPHNGLFQLISVHPTDDGTYKVTPLDTDTNYTLPQDRYITGQSHITPHPSGLQYVSVHYTQVLYH